MLSVWLLAQQQGCEGYCLWHAWMACAATAALACPAHGGVQCEAAQPKRQRVEDWDDDDEDDWVEGASCSAPLLLACCAEGLPTRAGTERCFNS